MERQYVGMDLHRRTSTIYRMDADGEVLGCVKIPSQPYELVQAMAEAGEHPEVVLGPPTAGRGSRLLQELGATVHLAHPLGNNWGNRRVKNDERDAKDLAAMLRLGRPRGMDRPAADPRAPRARALPVSPSVSALQLQGPGARGHRQERRAS